MKKLLLISAITILFSTCCDDGLARYLDFYNSSGNSVCYYMPWQWGIYYPDTILPEKNPVPYKFNDSWSLNFGNPGMNEDQLFATFPTDTLSIFFFDPDVLSAYEWEEIRKGYKILIRYDLSHEDLKKLKWRIDYPPTENMKDMKMYPPYK